MKKYFPVMWVLLVLGLLGYGLFSPDSEGSYAALGKPARAFELKDTHNQKFIFDGTPERLTVVNFWAAWCGPCHQEAPDLRKVSDQYQGRVDFVGVGLDDPEPIKTFVADYGLKYPNLTDAHSKVGIDYGIGSIPVTLIIRPDGTVSYHKLGAVTAAELSRALDGML